MSRWEDKDAKEMGRLQDELNLVREELTQLKKACLALFKTAGCWPVVPEDWVDVRVERKHWNRFLDIGMALRKEEQQNEPLPKSRIAREEP